jgi:hypothetical protein
MKRISAWLLTLLVLTVAAGCDDGSASLTTEPAPQPKAAVEPKTAEPKPVAKAKEGGSDRPSVAELQKELDVISRGKEPSKTATQNVSFPEDLAVRKVTTAIKASLELGPTLVVWIVDRTPSAQRLVSRATGAAKAFYDSPDVRDLSAKDGSPLLTAVLTFDDQVQFVVNPPTGDRQKAQSGFDAVRSSTASREMTFTAIKQALEKYLPLRTDERREVLLVVITDEAGDDPQVADELLDLTRRNAIPVYCIGLPAPWGETSPFALNPKVIDSTTNDETPTVGPESLYSERVDIQGWAGGYAAKSLDLVDSGFGPFALERLCRASRGQYFAIRGDGGAGNSGPRGTSFRYWPPGGELRFDDNVVKKYAPDYVSKAEYQKLLAGNKARKALHEAAKLPKVTIEGRPDSRFPKGAEGKTAKKMSQAQQFAAKNSPAVDKLYDTLAAGESDRDKLTSPRWQAEFDLAMGRVMANKVRLDGYNSMIAALKRGKTFQNANSTTWVLEQADAFETESTIKRMGERAKMYLERVIKEHPGTPWARIAEEELKSPLGWTWKET